MKPVTIKHPGVPDGITIAVETVTPDQAREWLSTQTRNRKLKARHIANLRRDIEQGQWRFTGAGISLDASGTLIDGQHRLPAICQTGISLPLVIFRGFPAAVQDSMDLGAGRTVWEQLGMDGVGSANHLVSYCNAIAGGFCGHKSKLSLSQVKAMLAVLPDVAVVVQYDSPKLQYRSSTYLGMIALAFHIPGQRKRVALFFDAFTRGIGIDGETSPAWRMREHARLKPSFGGSRTALVSYLCDCLQAWVDGERMPTARPTGTGSAWLKARLLPLHTTIRTILGYQS